MEDPSTERRRTDLFTQWLRDHDILIEVKTIVTHLEQELASDRKETWERMGTHDSRLRTIESLVERLQPMASHAKYDRMMQEWEEFKITRKAERRVYATIAAVVSTVLTLLLSPFSDWLFMRVIGGR